MLFNFQLHLLTEIAPFGTPPDLHLHWFGLTDGWYWIDTGGEELFRYTPEMVEYWRQFAPETQPPSPLDSYPDYYVVRLWEDVLELLPAALEPLPAPLVVLLATQASWDDWFDRFHGTWNQEDDEDIETTDLYADAIEWWKERYLSANHLRGGFTIHFWTDGNHFFIDWDNREREIEGIPAWSATWGRATMPLQVFIDELISFDKRLIEAMSQRIEEVKANWPFSDVHIDVDGLQKEQVERSGWLAKAFKQARERPPTDWAHVLSLLEQIKLRQPGH